MPYTTEEEFYRCPECGCPYFVDASQLVLKRESPKLSTEEFDRQPPIVTQTIYRYKCSDCGKVLPRAEIAEKALAATKQVQKIRVPNNDFEQMRKLEKEQGNS